MKFSSLCNSGQEQKLWAVPHPLSEFTVNYHSVMLISGAQDGCGYILHIQAQTMGKVNRSQGIFLNV